MPECKGVVTAVTLAAYALATVPFSMIARAIVNPDNFPLKVEGVGTDKLNEVIGRNVLAT